jgi:hypothetical protein
MKVLNFRNIEMYDVPISLYGEVLLRVIVVHMFKCMQSKGYIGPMRV